MTFYSFRVSNYYFFLTIKIRSDGSAFSLYRGSNLSINYIAITLCYGAVNKSYVIIPLTPWEIQLLLVQYDPAEEFAINKHFIQSVTVF